MDATTEEVDEEILDAAGLPGWATVYADLQHVFGNHAEEHVHKAFERGDIERDDLADNASLRHEEGEQWMVGSKELYDRFGMDYRELELAPSEQTDFNVTWRDGPFDGAQFYLSVGTQFLVRAFARDDVIVKHEWRGDDTPGE